MDIGEVEPEDELKNLKERLAKIDNISNDPSLNYTGGNCWKGKGEGKEKGGSFLGKRELQQQVQLQRAEGELLGQGVRQGQR